MMREYRRGKKKKQFSAPHEVYYFRMDKPMVQDACYYSYYAVKQTNTASMSAFCVPMEHWFHVMDSIDIFSPSMMIEKKFFHTA